MGRFLFVMTRGLEDPTRVTRALQLAKVAKEQDHDVNLFLTDDAVVLAKPSMADQVKAPTGDEAKSYLDFLIDKAVPIYV
jgi:predicted peroxiredoxin